MNNYDQQENRLSNQSAAFLGLMQQRGILADDGISDEARRKAE